jgi:hypothetical protein
VEKGCIVKILEHNDVNPLKVLYLNQMALNSPLTPEKAAHIRRTDPRPFPCLPVYVVENGAVLGQVGIFRLPMISIEGREEAGGVWAVSTFCRYRYRVVYELYRRHGYAEMRTLETALRPGKLPSSRLVCAPELQRPYQVRSCHG